MPRTIEECEDVIRGLSRGDVRLVRSHLRQRQVDLPRGDFYRACVTARVCQADLVLTCLRLNMLHAVEALIGKPITRLPPSRSRRTRYVEERERSVTRLRKPRSLENGKRRLLSSGLYERLSRIRLGMTTPMMRARGLSARDIHIATKRGYVTMA